jgi:hypothetical protein
MLGEEHPPENDTHDPWNWWEVLPDSSLKCLVM